MSRVKDAYGCGPECYLIVEDPEEPSTWHLTVRNPDGTLNHGHMGDAYAALHGGFRGNKYQGPRKAEAISKLKALYKAEGMKWPDGSHPAGPQLPPDQRSQKSSEVSMAEVKDSDGRGPECYLVVENAHKPSTWHLKVKDPDGKPNHGLMGGAWAALHGGYRGQKYDGPNRAQALQKLISLYKSEGMDTPSSASEPDRACYWASEDDFSWHFDGQPDMADVHVPGPIGEDGRRKKRSPMLSKLVRTVRAKLVKQPAISADEFEAIYRQSLGHAGGKSRAASDDGGAGDVGEWDDPCPACEKAGHGGTKNCGCPACQEGDPGDCLCQDLLDEEDSDEDDNMATESRAAGDRGSVVSDAGNSFGLFLPVQLGEAPNWIPYLPKPGSFQHPKYGKLQFTPERNARFVQNFRDRVYNQKLPIDIEHESKLSGAAGYVSNLRQNSDGSVDAEVEWTDRGRKMLSGDRFRYFSPEWYDKWQQPESGKSFQDVAIGGGITTRPWFKEQHLRPLVASEHGIQVFDEDSTAVPPAQLTQPQRSRSMADAEDMAVQQQIDALQTQLNKLKVAQAADMKSDDGKSAGELQRQLSEQEQKIESTKARIAEAQKAVEKAEASKSVGDKQMAELALSTHEARLEMAEGKAGALKEQIKMAAAEQATKDSTRSPEAKRFAEVEAEARAAKEEVAALKVLAQRREFAETAKGWPGDVDQHVTFMEKLDEDGRKFYSEQQRAIAAQLAESDKILTSHLGVSSTPSATSAEGRLQAFAEAAQKADPKLSKAQAYTAALDRHPDLYEQSLRERGAQA